MKSSKDKSSKDSPWTEILNRHDNGRIYRNLPDFAILKEMRACDKKENKRNKTRENRTKYKYK